MNVYQCIEEVIYKPTDLANKVDACYHIAYNV